MNVLLSTWNGEKYLRQLLDSVIRQTYREIYITIRDDYSSDRTKLILDEYASKYSHIQVKYGEENLGAANSFFWLLQNAKEECSYFAFCDQDDVWKEFKIARAVEVISRIIKEQKRSLPVMYCSAYDLVDENLNHIESSCQFRNIRPSFLNAMVENIATGCTVVLNKLAWELLNKQVPRYVLMHDWWAYLVVSAFGQVVFDPIPTVYYRQHGGNTIGVGLTKFQKWKRRVARFVNNKGKKLITRQLEEFRRIYGDWLSAEKKLYLDSFLQFQDSFWKRIKYVAHTPVYRQTTIDNLIFKILYLLNVV